MDLSQLNELSDLTEQIQIDPTQAIGIPIALLGAVFLSFGTQYQSRGVGKVEQTSGRSSKSGLDLRHLLALFTRPSWVIGTLLLGLAIVLQLTSLNLAPLTVVQPLGAVALVITAVLNARISKVRLGGGAIRAIAFCVGGVALFVTVAALTAVDPRVTDEHLITILVVLAIVGVLLGGAWLALRDRVAALFYILAAGVLYGFVATLAKVVIGRITQGDFEWLTVLCIVGLLLAAGLGGYFVQTAYSSGPPDLVIAGLTVIDPIVAVVIGIVVLGEASQAPPIAGVLFAAAGAIAIYGVFQLAKHHPQVAGSEARKP